MAEADRLDQLQDLIENFLTTSVADRVTSNKKMIRLETLVETLMAASSARMDRLEALVGLPTNQFKYF